ncbi:hypothetical protein PLICRDRAFT_55450 [Plicaturopsis crispa FD-325 SS-3]|nr:hypothetical protein PLICRDRAFT_55450 [Plicaturopsis crispa FD-325 SS-3]
MHNRPDKPLLVKCEFNDKLKKITFSSARNCTLDLLKGKIEQGFSLYGTSYTIAYIDDDGEISNITTDFDITDAIQYFQAGTDDPPTSSASSILSGRSFGSRKITMKFNINVDFTGSLSDTSSLASMEEYNGRNGSNFSLSYSAPPSVEHDDDSITVSSRDTGAAPTQDYMHDPSSPSRQQPPQLPASMSWQMQPSDAWAQSMASLAGDQDVDAPVSRSPSISGETQRIERSPFDDHYREESLRVVNDPSAVFERLKLAEGNQTDTGHDASIPSRGAAWLRDQKARNITTMLGVSPEPSESDAASVTPENGAQMDGELSLKRDTRGKFYYSYTTTGSSSASQTHDSGYDDRPSVNGEDASDADVAEERVKPPSAMNLDWLAAQQVKPALPSRSYSEPSNSRTLSLTTTDDSFGDGADTDFQLAPLLGPPPHELTECSECGVLLNSIRYVCTTCGVKKPARWLDKGKGRSMSPADEPMSYPPSRFRNLSSSSSHTFVGQAFQDNSSYDNVHKPLPSLPHLSLIPGQQHAHPDVELGYELCSGCIETSGVNHALEMNLSLGSSPARGSPSSPEDTRLTLSQMRRAAPAKGKVRHAYLERIWGHDGWEDVQQEDVNGCRCSTCGTAIISRRYKCASCKNFNLCLACYHQVHEVHPSHAFLAVPDRPIRSYSESDLARDVNGPQSMQHAGIKCAHCALPIIGARFHCALCESVDICSNCDSAGLPGNLDSSENGHNSSHIMIKIPIPVKSTEVRTASRRALDLLQGRDAATVGHTLSRSKPSSVVSSYTHTVVGSRPRDHPLSDEADHNIMCSGCSRRIVGVRYQCACCPSSPHSYSLCAACEARSYVVHDPMHLFFKIPRPVDRPLESAFALLPILYKAPAGPIGGLSPSTNPREYLKSLQHRSALCDRCMERTGIQGAWFRCAYCSKDLCDACQAIDTHDDKHVFYVLKGPVDMPRFRHIANVENPPPVIQYPIYD